MPKVFLRTSNIFELFCHSFGSAKLCLLVFFALLSLLCLPLDVLANNLSVTNAAIINQDADADTIEIEFDISWENSWRDAINYDAAWVFFKYSKDSAATWNHVTLKTSGTNPSGFSRGTGTGVDVVVPSDKKGCFIQRSSQGTGILSTSNLRVVWDYGQDGVSDAEASAAATSVKVFGVEMVYIPQGGFYAGDGSDGISGEFEHGGASANLPGAIDSESGLSFGTGTTQWYYNTDAGADDAASGGFFEVSASFPKGFAAFYAMKYEITEGQWIGFFNTLTAAQKTTRDITSASGKNSDAVVDRNTVAWASGDATTTRADRGCGYLSFQDLAAYADWAGLRPMTELEFEKLARGSLYPVDGEYAWGTTALTACTNLSGTSEDGTEVCDTPTGNRVNFGNTNMTGGDGPNRGPLRAGIFATAATTTRVAAGAGYFGNMELSGNLWERVVTLGNGVGRGFSGSHGDGVLSATASYEGNATNLDWPGIDASSAARGVTGASGTGLKGGGWSGTSNPYMEVSNRAKAATTDATRGADYGGRCVRTAP